MLYASAGSNGGRAVPARREVPEAGAEANWAGAPAAVVLLSCDSLLDVLQVGLLGHT